MKFFAIIIYILFTPILIFAQPTSRRDIPVEFHFRFFGKQGEIVTPDNKQYKIKINFKLPSSFYRVNDSVKFDNEYFSCTSFSGAMVSINFISESDTMKIYTSTSHDSIPFLKGNYIVPMEYAPLFSIMPHNDVKIKKRDWENFKVSEFKQIIFPDTLKKTDCQFWKNYKSRIPLDFTPSIYGLLYNPDFSAKIYAWDWNNLYVSRDQGKNWENILSVNEPYEKPIVFFKDKNTLLLIKTKKYERPINKIPEVYLSKDDGLTWKIDSNYTKMGAYYLGFNKGKKGFAYSVKYLKDENIVKTVFYVTKDGGKKWKETSIFKGRLYYERLFPQSILHWEKDTITVSENLAVYISYDGGESWDIISNNFKYINSFEGIYPSFYGSEFIHHLEKIDKTNRIITKLLTFKDDWYIDMIAVKNIWCISGQRYTIISKDQGKNWNYYYGSVAGESMFTIIDNKYIFNGRSLFKID